MRFSLTWVPPEQKGLALLVGVRSARTGRSVRREARGCSRTRSGVENRGDVLATKRHLVKSTG